MRDIGHADFALLLSASRVPTRGERLDNSHSGRWVLCSSTGTSGFRSRGSDESASSLRIRIPARKPSQDKQRSKNLIFSSSQLHCEDACVRLRQALSKVSTFFFGTRNCHAQKSLTGQTHPCRVRIRLKQDNGVALFQRSSDKISGIRLG